MKHYVFAVSDYEHSGDLAWAEKEVRSNFPNVKNIKSYEKRDYESEADYENEYGECDEHIYQGYVEFDAPDEYRMALEEFSL